MKIIAKTDGGYLVETTEHELAQACGFRWDTDKDWRQHTASARNRNEHNQPLAIGGEIQVIPANGYLQQLRDKEATVRVAGKTLRELSELMLGALPTAVIPPAERGNSGEG